jgi:hypothetical protein
MPSRLRKRALLLPQRPKVYFEEWDDPMISGIAWVSELIELPAKPLCRLVMNAHGDRLSGTSASTLISVPCGIPGLRMLSTSSIRCGVCP